ncbi:phytoene synthase [Pedobacter kyungheensis]|uniref:Phytoene synthase n=1 Tax=Pedobacter kyungheensis TaxID=1069985 RepID=A0A0C1FXR4_9SPHI|nr:phytoene/squalene synthase family protein [Pedobacter kyungheensis]KIA96603.1 phytoene synthase [Pedobacter kyungheensis]
MKQLFDELSFKVSKAVTQKYSTSFSIGIFALSPAIRPWIYAIYGYVRLADEIVDSFHGYDKATLLNRFRADTWMAIDEKISLNPILQAFQETVNRYSIDRSLIEQFLNSMEMDLEHFTYDYQLYQTYILGSAEVVGLMCLKVFVNGDACQFESLKPAAMKLGSAFQKVNFLRDLKADSQQLGRCYFPGMRTDIFDNKIKCQIQEDIETDFEQALEGIRKLPMCARFGVYLAYNYYWSLFKKIKNTPAEMIMHKRIRIPNTQKISLAMSSYISYKMAIAKMAAF